LINIKIIRTYGQLILPFADESIDMVLFYDVLHYLKETARKKLCHEAFRILEPNGLISVYPKHSLDDNPIMEFKSMSLEEIRQEIQDSNFIFNKKHCGFISHDDSVNRGCVINFGKV